jgi:hypothetical protein
MGPITILTSPMKASASTRESAPVFGSSHPTKAPHAAAISIRTLGCRHRARRVRGAFVVGADAWEERLTLCLRRRPEFEGLEFDMVWAVLRLKPTRAPLHAARGD